MLTGLLLLHLPLELRRDQWTCLEVSHAVGMQGRRLSNREGGHLLSNDNFYGDSNYRRASDSIAVRVKIGEQYPLSGREIVCVRSV